MDQSGCLAMPIWKCTYGVREEDGPAVANVVVEVDGTVGGLGIEVGGSRAQAKTVC